MGALIQRLETRPLSEGKMYGVLVAERRDGSVGWLAAFSGMLEGRFEVEGWAPPLFDAVARARVEVPGLRAVEELHARALAHQRGEEGASLREARERMEAAHAEALGALERRNAEKQRQRHVRRAEGVSPEVAEALNRESQHARAERKRLRAALAEERDPLDRTWTRWQRRHRALERLRQAVCRRVMQGIHDSYTVHSFDGGRAPLRSLYGEQEPPAGAGDCAAPKLFAAAQRLGMRPLAWSEFWWGPPPPGGGRVAGVVYPPCKDKCGPLLSFMLRGSGLEAPPHFAPRALPHSPLRRLYEDETLAVVAKPAGLLSVPGRDRSVTDSLWSRVRAHFPTATGPLLVHRLDMDVSGLVLVALTATAHAALQRQFSERTVDKRYVAWLSGVVQADRGTIDLPLRVDLENRPRHIVCDEFGKPALTRFEVLRRESKRTRVLLFPLTGRTHQLRVHVSHARGLDAPIVGDRLYGREDERLYLHAEALAFTHPDTQERMSFELPAPF